MPYAEARHVKGVDECWFYHVMDLPGGQTTGGQWDMRGRIRDYIGHVDVAGKRVLDVGTASGFLTFEMEKLGAEMVSLDADEPGCYFNLPYRGIPFNSNRPAWESSTREFMKKLNNSYWLAHRLYGSKARVAYAGAYAIPEDLGQFDVVMIGQILVHLSDPVRALSSAMARCRGRIVVTEGMIESEAPTMTLCARAAAVTPSSWWQLSTSLYRELFTMAGFEIERVEKGHYRCIAPGMPDQVELTTIVARRK